MNTDLRRFLADLEARFPQSVLRIKEPIDHQAFEATALLKDLEERGEERIVLFENVRDLTGKPSPFPLLMNLFVSRRHCAMALGLPPEAHRMELSTEFAKREERRGSCVEVARGQAPVKEIVWTGKDADVRRLPIPMHHADDVAPYLTMICVMKGLSGNFYDATYTKNMVQGGNRMSLSAHRHHHLDRIVQEYEAAGKSAPVAIVLGHHPAFSLGTCALDPFGVNDYEMIARFLDAPLRLTPSETWGADFLVPADAEIIVEAEVLPGVRANQNPFGEIAGYYQEVMSMPVVEVRAITARQNGLFESIFPGHPEHWNLGGIPKEGSVYNSIKRTIPGLTAIHLPPSGCCRFTAYLSLKKGFESDPRKAAMQAFVEMPNLKWAVVVDEDVDVFNEREVLWAVATRTWWEQDLQIIDKVQSFRGWLGSSVAIIDATRPRDRSFPKKNEIPEEALRKIRARGLLA